MRAAVPRPCPHKPFGREIYVVREQSSITSDTARPIYAFEVRLTEYAFTGEYLSRFHVQSDDTLGTPANGPSYHSLPSACRTKAIISTCFKITIGGLFGTQGHRN